MKNKKLIITVIILLIVIAAGIAGYMAATRVYTLDEMLITGNEVYDDEKLKEILLDDENSWSTLYVFFKYKYFNDKKIPFIDTLEIDMPGPHTISVRVYEKGILGCLYIESVGQYAYFDKDGFVAEISSEKLPDVPQVSGIKVGSVVLYERLDLENSDNLSDLLLLAELLKKYEISADEIEFSGSEMKARIKKIEVNIGSSRYLTEKIMRLQKILPKLKKKKGVLHLENWTEQTTDIIFDPA